MFAPAGQEEAQVQQAQELAAGDSYNYGGDGSGISNPYLGVASDETISQLQNAITAGNRSGAPGSFNRPTLTFDQYNALRGTTLADPFRDNPAGIASLIPFDYRGQRDTLDDLERQYALFANPYGQIDMRGGTNLDTRSEDILFKDMNRLSKRPFDQGNKEEGELRSGLQTQYGDLFGTPTGMPTVMGEVRAQDLPMSLSEMAARLAASATPLGPLVSLNPNRKLTLDTSPTYDPKLDPNSPDYEGTGGTLLGNILDSITGGAGTPALKQGAEYIKNSEAGIDLNKIISGIFSTDKGASAVNEMENSVDQTGSDVKLGPESFLNNEKTRDPMYFDSSPGRMRAVFGEGVASLLGGLTPGEAMRYANITKPSQEGTVPPYSDPLLSRDQQIAKDVSNILAYRNYRKGTDRIPENMAFNELYDKTSPGTTDYMKSLGFTRPF